jgi:hypothetical protein
MIEKYFVYSLVRDNLISEIGFFSPSPPVTFREFENGAILPAIQMAQPRFFSVYYSGINV